MAAKGIFTFHDLYLGRGREYLYRKNLHESSSASRSNGRWFQSYSADEDLSQSLIDEIDSITHQNSESKTNSALDQPFVGTLEKIDTFAYLYWFLIALAIALTLLLAIVVIYYCCNRCKRKRKQRKEKQDEFLPNFYRYQTVNRDAPTYNLYQSTAPLFFSSPVPSYKSKLSDSGDDQLLRQGLDAVGTPQSTRTDTSHKKSINSFTSSASDILTEIKDRLNNRSSKRLSNGEKIFETQGADMALSDESKNITS